MTIYVKMPDGVKVLSLLVVSTTTIGNVKMLVKNIEGVPKVEQRLKPKKNINKIKTKQNKT